MNKQLLNFYFEKGKFKRKFSNSFLQYYKGNYRVKISEVSNKIYIFLADELIYETGLPVNEASVVKWCNILIDKYEKGNQTQTDTDSSGER